MPVQITLTVIRLRGAYTYSPRYYSKQGRAEPSLAEKRSWHWRRRYRYSAVLYMIGNHAAPRPNFIHLTMTFSALTIAALAASAVGAQEQAQSRVSLAYVLSHLSPLVDYSPASAWDVTRAGHVSSTPGSTFYLPYWGQGSYVYGKGSNISVSEIRPARVNGPMFLETLPDYGSATNILLRADGFYPQRNYTPIITVNNGGYANVTTFQVITTVPMQRGV